MNAIINPALTLQERDKAHATLLRLQRERMERATRLVAEITGHNAEYQRELMFDTAFEWLQQIGLDDAAISAHTKTAQFWGFWKTEWYRVDIMFINEFNFSLEGELGSIGWKAIYSDYHNVKSEYLNHPVVRAGFNSLMR
jgi:hypothetical protein